MDYAFEPKKTRDTVLRIAQRFGARAQQGFNSLLALITGKSFAEWARMANDLPSRSVDLLAQGYLQASLEAQLGITAILGFRRDGRWSDVGQHLFFMAPPVGLLQTWREGWSQLSAFAPRLTDAAWLVRFLEKAGTPDPLAFLIEELQTGKITLASGRIAQTPLFARLSDYLFDVGGPLLTYLSPELVHVQAGHYLARGDAHRVQVFLSSYPVTARQPAFLEQVAARYGPPDPRQSAFYQALEEPVLWGIRQQLFQLRMKNTSFGRDRQVFWASQLHRCQDWFFQDGEVRIHMEPLWVREVETETRISLHAYENEPFCVISHHGEFDSAMAQVVTKFLGW